MASISRRFLHLSRRCPSRPSSSSYIAPKHTSQWQRSISSTPSRRDDDPTPPKKAGSTSSATPPAEAAAALRKLVEDLKQLDPDLIDDAVRKGKQGISWMDQSTDEMDEDDWVIPEEDMRRVGFWGEGEEELGKDEDYYGDDLTSLGHGELENHRELREYARLIAWELPLLNQLARPFELPTEATPFRFRYTSYLGESHPATNKVVCEFSPSDLPISPQQKSKLIKLAGVRYNPSLDAIKISCEAFDTQAQNKRFIGETIERLVKEARDERDMFEDVPFDFRHHKPKKRYEFPEEWKMTRERRQYLEEKRKQTLQLDDQKLNNGQLINGKLIVETSLPEAVAQLEPVMLTGPRGKRI